VAVNQELLALFEEDQADRRGELPDDLFCAAMVFQHGSDRAHYRRADDRPRPRRRGGRQGGGP
jgi:hypothetical protein